MKNKFLFLVPFITLMVGFIPFLLFSIYYSVFISKSIVDIPLIFNTSVMIGDSILLPLINYKIIKYMLKIGDVTKQYKKLFISSMIIFILLSSVMNYIIHFSWSNDTITDFIAFAPGRFSIIGIWHLFFSIIQTTVFLIFILLWYLSVKSKKFYLLKELKKIWLLIFFFTLLSMVDMLVKYIFVFSEKSFYEVLLLDKFAFVTPLIAIGLFIFFNFYEKREK